MHLPFRYRLFLITKIIISFNFLNSFCVQEKKNAASKASKKVN